MRAYLDGSVISRLHYGGREKRFHDERNASTVIVGLIRLGVIEFVASDWLLIELCGGDKSMAQRRIAAVPPYQDIVGLSDDLWDRAAEIASRSMALEDAVHTAAAELGEADVLLTFDDKYVRGARSSGKLKVRVVNATEWVKHVYQA